MKRIIYITLLTLLIADLSYSFYQHYHMPLYGDIADIVMPEPEKGYYMVLHDPLGLEVLLNNKIYPNPNRFFAHRSVVAYFLNMPLVLQKLTGPIESVYLSCAIAKIITQILIIYLLAVYISNTSRIFKPDLVIAAALITPLFQTAGFARSMGIIDQSVIYTFFYALPLGLLMLAFLPFFNKLFNGKELKFNPVLLIVIAIFMIFLSLNGPLIPGVVLIICPMVFISLWRRNFKSTKDTSSFYKRLLASFRKIPVPFLIIITWSCALSLYSLYVGRNNELNFGDSLPVIERYEKLPAGLFKLLIKKIGLPLILITIGVNAVLIGKRYRSAEGRKILKMMAWIGVFALIYILLLPLGGFRTYRENIIRYDTIMPLTLGLFLLFGMTSFYLLKNVTGRIKIIYVTGLVIILAIFTNADRLNLRSFQCERTALETLARSTDTIILLESDCPVMDWRKTTDYRQTILIAKLLDHWNITDGIRLFHFKDLDYERD
jgi:hypothetical protein